MYAVLARFYDQIHAELTEDVAFSVALARAADGRVLELGCGTGRLLWPLAQAGVTVTGVDNSAEMLAIAHERRQQLDLQERVGLISADMTHFSLSQTDFALALLSYNTALHLDESQTLATLRRTAMHLRPAGLLCIDVVNPFLLADWPDQMTPEVERTFVEPLSGATVTQSTTNCADPTRQTVTVNWLFDVVYPNGKMEMVESAETYHYRYPHEWLTMLQHSGFNLENMWGDYDETPFDEDASRLLLVARKNR